jgi:hypothetical protein
MIVVGNSWNLLPIPSIYPYNIKPKRRNFFLKYKKQSREKYHRTMTSLFGSIGKQHVCGQYYKNNNFTTHYEQMVGR